MVPSRGRRRAGFTLADLAVSVLLVGLAGPPLVSAFHARARDRSDRSACANNLRSIALAAQMYANNEVRTGAFPRTPFDNTGNVPPTEYTGWNSPYSFDTSAGKGGVAANDVSASLFLLMKTQDITSEVFVCPSSDAVWVTYGPNDSAQNHSNWKSRQNLGYSYACPFPTPKAIEKGWKLNNSLGSDFPLASDMNPGGQALLSTSYSASWAQMQRVNSPNHQRAGQNVVYCDAHVEFQQTAFCGAPRPAEYGPAAAYRDNIFTVGVGAPGSPGGTGIKALPEDPYDSVLLPTLPDGFQPPSHALAAAARPSPLLLGAAALALFLLVGLTVLLVLTLRKARGGRSSQ